MRIKTKILFPAIALTILVSAAILVSNIVLFSDFVDELTADRVKSASQVAAHHLDDLKMKASAVSLNFAENQGIINAIENNDRDALSVHALGLMAKTGVDFCTISNQEGIVIVRTHAPEKYGDSVASQANVRSAMAGTRSTVIENGATVSLAVRSSIPVFSNQDAMVGIVTVGYRLDTEQYVDSIKDITGCEATVFLKDERISTTVLNKDGARALGTTANPRVSEQVLAGVPFTGEADVLGRTAVAMYVPVAGPDGRAVGMLFVGQYMEKSATTIRAFIQRGLAIAFMVLAIFAAVLLMIAGRIVTPIHAMTRAASVLAAGDTDITIQVNTKDEMRTLADAFNRMVENTRDQVQTVEKIARGDVAVSVTMRSEKDVMNRALEELNKTLHEQAATIRKEHERVRLMLDATPLACRLWDKNFNLIECNEAAVRLFGLESRQEYLARFFELSPECQPDGQTTRRKIIEAVAEALETGECAYEWLYRRLDGEPIPCEVTLVRVPYGGDYVVAAYSRDLREQRKMLAEIEYRDKLLDTSRRASFILFDTAEDKNIESILMECMGLLGQCVDADQIYLTQNEMVDGVPHFACKTAWVSDPGRVKSAISPGMRFPWGLDSDWDERFRRGECMNGPVKDLPPAIQGFFAPFATKSVLVIPVFVQEIFWGLVGFSDCGRDRFFGKDEVDILRSMSLIMAAAVNRSEQAAHIREAHNRIRLLTNSTPLGFNLWDGNHNNIETNDTAVTLFGVKDQQEYLERFYELSPERQPDGGLSHEKSDALVRRAFDEGRLQFEWLHRKLDGTPIPSEVTLVRLAYGDGHVVAGYIRDLREHKRMLAAIELRDHQLQIALTDAQEANNAKSDFLAHMSHEIRTPLNAVVGLSELILDADGLDGDMEDKLEKIHDSGVTILSIVNDILDISKIESGKFELNPVRYDTPSLINDVVTLNSVRIGEKAISFRIDVDENLPGSLCGDDLRVKQIFNNLISNAFKYTHSGTVEWRMSFERDGDCVWLVSSVRDTGIGIKPDDAKKLFSAYNQVDTQRNRLVEGTGLGLAITKRLVEMMDGTITMESEYGKGTTFNVRLRQALASAAPIGGEVAQNLMDLRYALSKRARNIKLVRINLSYAHVLVVDDIVTNLDVVKGMMKPYSMKVDCAVSGPQAIEMIQTGSPRYNAVFMDHMMPGMDGIEATRIIREEIDTDYARNIPIIALTANAIVGNEKMFLEHGFQAFISKPIDVMRLDSILRQWVRDKKLEKELWSAEEDALPPDAMNRDSRNGASPLEVITINGLDMDRALERFNGDASILMDVLHSYAANTPPLLERLREYIEAEKLDEYAIVVHGIKGSSYGILARDAGNAAEALETAARAGDVDAVRTGHPAFEKIVEVLLNNMREAFRATDLAAGKPIAAEPDPALLRELRAACETYDMDGVDSAMARLGSFRYERGEKLVAWLRKQVGDMTFEEIAAGEWPSG